jgi:hypothetical protein
VFVLEIGVDDEDNSNWFEEDEEDDAHGSLYLLYRLSYMRDERKRRDWKNRWEALAEAVRLFSGPVSVRICISKTCELRSGRTETAGPGGSMSDQASSRLSWYSLAFSDDRPKTTQVPLICFAAQNSLT